MSGEEPRGESDGIKAPPAPVHPWCSAGQHSKEHAGGGNGDPGEPELQPAEPNQAYHGIGELKQWVSEIFGVFLKVYVY